MIGTETKRIPPTRLPYLATATLLFWIVSANTHLDAALPSSAVAAIPQQVAQTPRISATLPKTDADNEAGHVLSPRDAELYRAAFVAQQASDWQLADSALTQVKDKILVGHVLADRYERRAPTLDEARLWLAAYADLPEAEDIYDKARGLKGFSAAHLTRPAATAAWGGNNSFETVFGFHAQAVNAGDAKKAHITARMNAALRRDDPLAARELLATEIQRGTLNADQASEITARIAAAFYYDDDIERARPMAHAAAAHGSPLGLWIDGLSAWKQQDYAFATRSFASLAQAPGLSAWDRAAASYWAYRGAKRAHDTAQAQHWLAEAAKYPHSFYGYMAANAGGRVGADKNTLWKLPAFTAKTAAVLAQYPAGNRALALVQIGHSDAAEDELRHLNLGGHRDLQSAVLALAEKAHMPSLSLQLGGIATNDNGQLYQAALYPVPPWQPADGFKVDRALLFALMKRESQFDPAAVSTSGACGLMQIMPSTAKLITNDKSKGRDCPDRLFDPATNMAMGQKYVRVLAGQPMIGDNLLLLLAAYNGGPGNLAHWMDGQDHSDPLLFMESLPAHETHDYVQQVLLHYWMYRSRLAEPENSVAQLARGEWPRYALNDNAGGATRRADGAHVLEVASAAK